MSTNKFFCFGDGFATGHIWPEWPDILCALYPQIEVKNYAAIGAGNEFIVNSVIKAHQKNPDAFFLIQWALPQRFDKLLQDNTWDEIIDNDPVYYFNKVNLDNETWWLSSASSVDEVKSYQKIYIQEQQSLSRTLNYMYLLQHLLKNQSVFFFTYAMHAFEHHNINQSLSIISQDLESFSRKIEFHKIRGNEVQPSPPVHFAFLKKFILEKLPISPDEKLAVALENKINHFKWTAYHPDREHLWKLLVESAVMESQTNFT